MAIYRNGNSYSASRGDGGVNITEAIERLSGKKRGKSRLPAATERDAIGVAKSETVPSGVEPGFGGGITSPLVEQAYAGSTYYSLVSSDGLFTFEFPDTTTYTDDDGAGDAYVFEHIDPEA